MNTLIVAAFRWALMFLVPALVYADSAQWDLNPISGDWNTADNWTPMTVPNGSADIATFALSNTTNVSISTNTIGRKNPTIVETSNDTQGDTATGDANPVGKCNRSHPSGPAFGFAFALLCG
jgi:hypothetical protein